jgi:hypothetical protein
MISISGAPECPVTAPAATLVRAADEALYQAKRSGRNKVLAHEPAYLGGNEAQTPLPVEEKEGARERLARTEKQAFGAVGEAVTLAADATPSRGTRVAADFTPVPGTLLAIASVTPAAGVPKLTLEPRPAVLSAALAGGTSPPSGGGESKD